jgi:hypothetical protein
MVTLDRVMVMLTRNRCNKNIPIAIECTITHNWCICVCLAQDLFSKPCKKTETRQWNWTLKHWKNWKPNRPIDGWPNHVGLFDVLWAWTMSCTRLPIFVQRVLLVSPSPNQTLSLITHWGPEWPRTSGWSLFGVMCYWQRGLAGPPRSGEQVGSTRGTWWPAGSSAGCMVARKVRQSCRLEPV